LETRASIDSGTSSMSFSVLVAPTANNYISLSEMESLRNVVDKYWRSNKPLELYYTSKKIKNEK
jgi:E3 ubiquitin-protein ligase RNF1/2